MNSREKVFKRGTAWRGIDYCGRDLAYYLLIKPKNEKHVAFLGVFGIHKYGPDGI